LIVTPRDFERAQRFTLEISIGLGVCFEILDVKIIGCFFLTMTSLDPPNYSQTAPNREVKTNVNQIKVTPARNVKEELKRANTAKEQKNRLYTIVCLLCIGVLVFGGGITMIIVGDLQGIEDFIVVGGLFLGLGIVFLAVIALTLLKPIRDRKKIAMRESSKNANQQMGYVDSKATEIDSPEDIKRRPKPSSDQLYGYDKLKIHLPGPEVVPPSRHKESPRRPPPPPPVALPNHGTSQQPMMRSLQREATLQEGGIVTSGLVNTSSSPPPDSGKHVEFY
jgi:hypothetical protein